MYAVVGAVRCGVWMKYTLINIHIFSKPSLFIICTIDIQIHIKVLIYSYQFHYLLHTQRFSIVLLNEEFVV